MQGPGIRKHACSVYVTICRVNNVSSPCSLGGALASLAAHKLAQHRASLADVTSVKVRQHTTGICHHKTFTCRILHLHRCFKPSEGAEVPSLGSSSVGASSALCLYTVMHKCTLAGGVCCPGRRRTSQMIGISPASLPHTLPMPCCFLTVASERVHVWGAAAREPRLCP